MMKSKWIWVLASCALGCAADSGAPADDDTANNTVVDGKADTLGAFDDLPLALNGIESEEQFDAMSFSGQGGVVIGKSVKFVIDARDTAAPVLRYMNARFGGQTAHADATLYHYPFAQETFGVPEGTREFNEVTYWTNDKRYVAGTLQQYELGDGLTPIYAMQFYPQDVIREETLLFAAELVATSLTIPDARVAFVPLGQQQTVETVGADLDAAGVEVLSLDDVLGSLDFIPMQTGEAWGFLRIFPQDHDELSALDIPVFDELPLDLTVVAGTITRAVQDASSHINLKSKERGTPNMVLRSAELDHATLAPFADQPVHLVVRADGFVIEATTADVVHAKLAEKLSRPWETLDVDALAVTTSYDDMCPADAADCLGRAAQWGGKAGNTGFLRHPSVLGSVNAFGSLAHRLGYEVAPAGVGVPVQIYFDFIANNPETEAAIADFIAAEKAGLLSVRERVDALKAIQAMIMDDDFGDDVVEEIQSLAVGALGPVENLKVRSSANAEDIPGFDGAGLYDSFRVRLSDDDDPSEQCTRTWDDEDAEWNIRPRTLRCVMKGVYASLWNKRAVEERSFARVDHQTAGMGLAIVERYSDRDEIAANSVVVTRVLNSSGVYGYSFSNQTENNVVTNPAAGTHSESIIAAFLPNVETTFTVTRFAKPDPLAPQLDETVMTHAKMLQMLEISQTVERAYCRANPLYYPGDCAQVLFDPDKPTSLDMEFKLYENGDFLCKQVREFAGR